MKRIILSVLALGATGVAMAQVNPQKGYVTTKFDDLGDADIDDPNFCGFDQIPSLSSQRITEESCDQRGQIIFPSNSLGDMEQFHNFAECQLWNHSEEKQNEKIKTDGK